MALQLPQLKSIGPTAPTQSVGVDVKTPDLVSSQIQQSKAVEGVIDNVAQYQEKKEMDAAKLTATAAQVEYHTRANQAMEKARSGEGDPTQAYADVRENWKQIQEDVTSKYKDSPNFVQAMIREQVSKADAELQNHASNYEMTQKAAYNRQVADSGVRLQQDSAMSYGTRLKVKEPETFANLQQAVNNMTEIRKAQLTDQGLIWPDENGKEQFTPQALLKIKEDRSKAYTDIISTLQASGGPDNIAAAQKLLVDHEDDLLSGDRKKLLAGHTKSIDKDLSLKAVGEVSNLPPDEAMEKLASKLKDNPRALEMAQGSLDALNRRKANSAAQAQKMASNDLAGYMRDKGFVHASEVEADPRATKMLEQIRSRPGGEEMATKMLSAFDHPKESRPAAKYAVWTNLMNQSYTKDDFGQFQTDLAGLSPGDRTKAENRYWSQVNQTDPEKQAMFVSMGKEIEQRLTDAGVLKVEYGKLNDASKVKMATYLTQMHDAASTLDPKKDKEQWVKNFVASQISGNAFTGVSGTKKKLITAADAPKDIAGTKAATAADMKDAAKFDFSNAKIVLEAQQHYEQVKGRPYDKTKGDSAAAVKTEYMRWKKEGK